MLSASLIASLRQRQPRVRTLTTWPTLSGRFLGLLIVFVMIAEVLIFVPAVSRFRVENLQNRLELGQLAALALLATPDVQVDLAAPLELIFGFGAAPRLRQLPLQRAPFLFQLRDRLAQDTVVLAHLGKTKPQKTERQQQNQTGQLQKELFHWWAAQRMLMVARL